MTKLEPNICEDCGREFIVKPEIEVCAECSVKSYWQEIKESYDPNIIVKIRQIFIPQTKTYKKAFR